MANPKGNPQNLKPFKKGQSGNPKGAPKKLPHLDELLKDILGDEKNNITLMQGIIMKLASKALAGDLNATKILLEYAYGKPHQSIDLTSGNEKIEAIRVIMVSDGTGG